jgi:hypothetical protein
MSFPKKLFGGSESPTQEEKNEEENLVDQLAAARARLRLVEKRKEGYVLEKDMPLTLIEIETQLREQIAELENKCIAHQGVKPVEDALARKDHLADLLATARENLLLIEGREGQYKSETDVPLELVRAEQRWRARIAELKNEVGEE